MKLSLQTRSILSNSPDLQGLSMGFEAFKLLPAGKRNEHRNSLLAGYIFLSN